METLLILPVILLIVALLLLSYTEGRRQTLHLPPGTPIYQSQHGQEQDGELLYSQRYRVMGRPDLLLKQPDGMIIPVEVKTGSTPARSPYHGHVRQVIVYCVLVEENFGVRPPHGVIRYPEGSFDVAFTPEREAELTHILAEMRASRRAATLNRSHHSAARCKACGFAHVCDQRLDIQMPLF